MMNAIETRRSVRTYTDAPIEAAHIEAVLRAAMQAPSAKNQQPWEFIVVQNKETLEKLAQLGPFAAMLNSAAAAIVVMGNTQDLPRLERWHQDASAATQNLLLRAAELGLGAVWIGVAPKEEPMAFIKEVFDLPDHLSPFSLVAMGHPKAENANHFVDRFRPERVHYESL